MNQSKFVAIPCNFLKAREKSQIQIAIGFGFPSYWLINWRKIFKLITSSVEIAMCGSRKYSYPHHGRSLEFPRERGGGGLKSSNFQGVGGFHGKLLLERVTNHIQNIESNIRSI